MKSKILKLVRKIEKEKGVRVLFLIESGSRGWGWESEDSDYDIRGVFVQDYLKIEGVKQHIDEISGKFDIVLWDFRKFLSLMIKSNPTVWEWLSSDLIYMENSIRKELRKIFEDSFSEYALKKHYTSMARQNFNKYILHEGTTANLKKYVYVLRSIACILWIEQNKSPPPKHYRKVIKLFPKNIYDFFEKIVKDKRKSESLRGRRNRDVDKYIASFFDKGYEKGLGCFNLDELNKIFKREAKRKNKDLRLSEKTKKLLGLGRYKLK